MCSSDLVVERIGNIHVAHGIDKYSVGSIQLLQCRQASISVEGGDACACNRRYDTKRIDLANTAVVGIGNVRIARQVHKYAIRLLQCGQRRRASIAANPET